MRRNSLGTTGVGARAVVAAPARVDGRIDGLESRSNSLYHAFARLYKAFLSSHCLTNYPAHATKLNVEIVRHRSGRGHGILGAIVTRAMLVMIVVDFRLIPVVVAFPSSGFVLSVFRRSTRCGGRWNATGVSQFPFQEREGQFAERN